MGFGSPLHWIIVLVIVLVIFGTKKLRNIGSDLGGAVKGFKDAVKEGEKEQPKLETKSEAGQTIEGEVKDKTNS